MYIIILVAVVVFQESSSMAVSNPKKVLRHELDSNHPCIPQSTQYNMLVRWKVCEERGQAIYIYIWIYSSVQNSLKVNLVKEHSSALVQ